METNYFKNWYLEHKGYEIRPYADRILNEDKSFEKLWQGYREQMKRDFGDKILVKDLMKMNSPESNLIFDGIINTIGKGVGSIINIFDPEIVVCNLVETANPAASSAAELILEPDDILSIAVFILSEIGRAHV